MFSEWMLMLHLDDFIPYYIIKGVFYIVTACSLFLEIVFSQVMILFGSWAYIKPEDKLCLN